MNRKTLLELEIIAPGIREPKTLGRGTIQNSPFDDPEHVIHVATYDGLYFWKSQSQKTSEKKSVIDKIIHLHAHMCAFLSETLERSERSGRSELKRIVTTA